MSEKKKILITGGKWMLAYDFARTQSEKYEIILVDREECDITSFASVMQCIALHQPDVLLNCAAYTAVDDAEDIGMKICFDVNTLGTLNLAKATSVFGVEFITISTDYVFDGLKQTGYLPTDACNPIGVYGMSKYLGERLAMDENPRTIIVRTSWLYGGFVGEIRQNTEDRRVFKNFVNTMLRVSETKTEVKVVSDQHGIPTSCVDLSCAISDLMDETFDQDEVGGIFHFSSACEEGGITWADFAREIFTLSWRDTKVIDCTSNDYPTKARRPSHSILKNDSDILLPDLKTWLARYLGKS
jgi:dTDP-4-dehydrorhamnose reductase